MAIRNIISFPEAQAILNAQSLPVSMSDPKLAQMIQDLKDTLLATPNGVGLAAVQIGFLKRIFVLRKDCIIDDIDKDSALLRNSENIITFINPKIISQKGIIYEEEGCLSVPGAAIKIKRAAVVKVRAHNEKGGQFYERFTGLSSRAVQQEMDHLNGVLILDHR